MIIFSNQCRIRPSSIQPGAKSCPGLWSSLAGSGQYACAFGSSVTCLEFLRFLCQLLHPIKTFASIPFFFEGPRKEGWIAG